MTKSRPITPRERHLLYVLAEEAAEVVQAATKLLRFGDRAIPAGHAGAGMTNVEHLSSELDDVAAVQAMLHEGGLDLESREDRLISKARRVNARVEESLALEAAGETIDPDQ